MKCKQKLCSRTKNLDKSGSCAICADAIFEASKNYEKNKKRIPSKVDVDLKLMVETHAKLAKGLQVDPKVVSNLLLGGVINILHQHDTIAEIDGRIKQVEQGSLSDKIRIESLENWVLKQCDEIKVLNEIVSRMDKDGVVIEENEELEKVKKKIIGVEIDIETLKVLKNRIVKDNSEEPRASERKVSIKCDECGETFIQACHLEEHMEGHGNVKQHDCSLCGKQFFLKWRLKKHMELHSENSRTKYCHYFNNAKECPFDKIGCMFRHENSKKCNFEECNRKLCQFTHKEIHVDERAAGESIEDSNEEVNYGCVEAVNTTIDESLNTESEEEIGSGQCHLCMSFIGAQDELMNHFEAEHLSFYNDMMEYLNERDRMKEQAAVSHMPIVAGP